MITTQQHLSEMQRYVAKVGMTPSALRNLGAKGFVKAAIDFLSSVNLAPLVSVNPSTYPRWLDAQTNALKGRLTKGNLKYEKKPSPCCFQWFTSR
jgi:hypothetical protein